MRIRIEHEGRRRREHVGVPAANEGSEGATPVLPCGRACGNGRLALDSFDPWACPRADHAGSGGMRSLGAMSDVAAAL